MRSAALYVALLSMTILVSGCGAGAEPPAGLLYPIVDTAQTTCYTGSAPHYRDNGDGTVCDLVTGLTWQADPGSKVTWSQAMAGAAACLTGGYDDWRVPTIKELYSLIRFNGRTGMTAETSVPYLDTRYFMFHYGNASVGDRFIDSQYCSSTQYVGTTMGGNATIFGVNFADGRIKGYPRDRIGAREKTYYCLYVRGNPEYGVNRFVDNGDGTITDEATGLMWLQDDSAALAAGPRADGRLNWQEALAWAEGLSLAGHDDWRLPNAKELQSIVDYTRAPLVTGTPALDPVFHATPIQAEDGNTDYGYYWTNTTHVDGPAGVAACYVSFGRAMGCMNGEWLDVHGAGAQRSDPKTGDPSAFPYGRGPQGDAIRIYNFVRCVRDAGYAAPPRTTTSSSDDSSSSR